MWNAMFKPGLTVTSNSLLFLSVPINVRTREDKVDGEGIPYKHPIP